MLPESMAALRSDTIWVSLLLLADDDDDDDKDNDDDEKDHPG